MRDEGWTMFLMLVVLDERSFLSLLLSLVLFLFCF